MKCFKLLLLLIVSCSGSDSSVTNKSPKVKNQAVRVSINEPLNGQLKSEFLELKGDCKNSPAVKITIKEFDHQAKVKCKNSQYYFKFNFPPEANGKNINVTVFSKNNGSFYESKLEVVPFFDVISKFQNNLTLMDFSHFDGMKKGDKCQDKASKNDPISCYQINGIKFETKNEKTSPIFDGKSLYFQDSFLKATNFTDNLKEFEIIIVADSDTINHDLGLIDVGDNKDDDYLSLRFDKIGHKTGCSECLKASISTTEGSVSIESGSFLQMKRKTAYGISWKQNTPLKIYIDGKVSSESKPIGGRLSSESEDFYIGQGPKGNWLGSIYKILIFEKELPEDLRKAVYHQLLN